MSDWQDKLSKLVYSTESGRVTEETDENPTVGETYKDGFVRVGRETKGRKGKGVIVITGIEQPKEQFKQTAQIIKKKCGTGGAVKGDTIEIQGDNREKVKSVLESLGFKCKLTGG